MTKPITEAQRVFYAYCDGYIRGVGKAEAISDTALHKEAKAYVDKILNLTQDE